MKINLKPLTCETARDMMFDYIEEELKAADALQLETHIHDCEACKKELSERRDILKTISSCGETPPASLKLGVMDKINTVPQETKRQRMAKRLLPASALSAAAAAVMLLFVGRVFLLGGAMNDADNAAFDKVADVEVMRLTGASAVAECADEDAVRDGAMMLADKAPSEPEAAKEAGASKNEASAVEYYTVTSALKAASPGFGLIIADDCDYVSFNNADNSTEALLKYAMSTLAAPSPIDSLFEKFRADDRAIIVCSGEELPYPDNFVSEETLLFGDTKFCHLIFEENATDLFPELLDNLERIGAYYRAEAPEGAFTELDLFLAVVCEEDTQ